MKTCFIVFIAAIATSLGATPLPKVTIDSGKLTLDADQTSLSEVLAIIGRQAEFTTFIMNEGAIKTAQVTDDFTNIPLKRGIERLLRDWNYALLTDQQTGAIKELYILGRKDEAVTSGASRQALPSSAVAIREAEVKATAYNEDSLQTVPPLENLQNNDAVELTKLGLQSANPADRLAALSKLNSREVDDTDLQDIRRLVETDPDPTVRAAALDALIRYDGTEEITEVLTTLADAPDDELQDIATEYLKRQQEEKRAVANIE